MPADDDQNQPKPEPGLVVGRSPLEGKEFPEVRVIDKRFWAQPEMDPDAPTAAAELNLKPSYVQELEQKMAAMEEKFREKTAYFVEESRRIQERLNREMERRLIEEKNRFIVEFADVLDNLELALGVEQARLDLPQLIRGVELVRDDFRKKLEKAGLQPIGAVGDEFNPRFHEAVEMRDVTDPRQQDKVVAVWRQGLVADDRLIRPARVTVGRFCGGADKAAEPSS